MANNYWIAKDKNNQVYIFNKKPTYKKNGWLNINDKTSYALLPSFIQISNEIIEININT